MCERGILREGRGGGGGERDRLFSNTNKISLSLFNFLGWGGWWGHVPSPFSPV